MSELMVDFITSLDGYAAAEGWPGWWGLEGPEYFAWLEEDSKTERTLLMGATTYRLMHGFAASGTEGVEQMDAISKVVFSSTLDEPLEWANTPPGPRRRRRGGARHEGRERSPAVHDRQPLTVPIAAESRVSSTGSGWSCSRWSPVRRVASASTTAGPMSASTSWRRARSTDAASCSTTGRGCSMGADRIGPR